MIKETEYILCEAAGDKNIDVCVSVCVYECSGIMDGRVIEGHYVLSGGGYDATRWLLGTLHLPECTPQKVADASAL